jgi:hypothetical protein
VLMSLMISILSILFVDRNDLLFFDTRSYSGLPAKPKIIRSCIFPLSNLHFELSADYVRLRAFIESFELIEIIMYLFRQSIVYWGSVHGIEMPEI